MFIDILDLIKLNLIHSFIQYQQNQQFLKAFLQIT